MRCGEDSILRLSVSGRSACISTFVTVAHIVPRPRIWWRRTKGLNLVQHTPPMTGFVVLSASYSNVIAGCLRTMNPSSSLFSTRKMFPMTESCANITSAATTKVFAFAWISIQSLCHPPLLSNPKNLNSLSVRSSDGTQARPGCSTRICLAYVAS